MAWSPSDAYDEGSDEAVMSTAAIAAKSKSGAMSKMCRTPFSLIEGERERERER